MIVTQERLAALLVAPQKDLGLEIKSWLDLQNSIDDKAVLAKAVLAIGNHGGGFVIIGMTETVQGAVEAPGRPASLDAYGQDLVNGIVHNYCDPPIHCTVHGVADAAGAVFPIVVVPGGHRTPLRARRAAPNQGTVQQNAIYVRRPGPRSETPQSAQDWNDLLSRCFANRRDEMFGQIRDLILGAVPQARAPVEPAKLEAWIAASGDRWRALIQRLPPNVGPRMPHGRFFFAYEILGRRRPIAPAELPEALRASVVRHTGWPAFWLPTRPGIAPYIYDGAVECWLAGDPQDSELERDAALSDFWRIHPDGLGFLLRGYQEDGFEAQRSGRPQIEPAAVFDVTSPVWNVGETLLQAQRLAHNLFDGATTVSFVATYEGLAGRRLTSLAGIRAIFDDRVARQDAITLRTDIDAEAIDANLPEIVHPLLSSLYALFDFFELPMQLVVDELARMRNLKT